MPAYSTNVGRTRVTGGLWFWLILGPFIVTLWLMGQMLKALVLVIAWGVREFAAHRQGKNALQNASPVPSMPAQQPQDAVPDGHMRRR